MQKFDVIVVGGGFCGVHVAKKLQRTGLSTLLIDSRDAFEFTPAIPKVVFNLKHRKKITVPFSSIGINNMKSTVTEITPSFVVANKKKYFFKYLVICTGSSYPVLLENAKNAFAVKTVADAVVLHKRLRKAKKVVIVGGGLVGVEMAGEIVTKAKDKKVTLIETGQKILGRNSASVSMLATDFLTNRGCKIVHGERVVKQEGKFLVTDKSKIRADVIVWCAGIKSDTKYLGKELHHIVNERKSIRVTHKLQVEGFPRLFAGGDINSIAEEKTAQNADRQARVIVHNILSLEKGNKLQSYVPRSGPLVISLGDWHGLFTFGRFVIPGFIPGVMKHIIEKALLFQIRYL